MLNYILLGMIQGLTEFFPVSSSAHLLIAQKLLKVSTDAVALSVILHLGTVLALIVFFFKDILNLLRDIKLMLFIFIVTLITGAIGVLGKDFFESLFTSAKPVAAALLITGAMLLLTKKFMRGDRAVPNNRDAIILGLTQGIAIIPGISRSGVTISTLLFRKIEREACFKISFLVSIPVILGAAMLEARKIDFALKADQINLLTGFFFSFFFGILSLWILKRVLRKAKLHYFGYYCILVAVITFFLLK
jgi:undecaprenyl-diphosphatase